MTKFTKRERECVCVCERERERERERESVSVSESESESERERERESIFLLPQMRVLMIRNLMETFINGINGAHWIERAIHTNILLCI